MMREGFTLIVLLILVLLADGLAAAVIEPNVALWAPKIEYHPGEVLLIRPRLPAVDTADVKNYELRLELPAVLREKELNLQMLDEQGGFLQLPLTRRHEAGGETQAFIFQPELKRYPGMKVIPGATYTFSCLAKGEGIVGSGFQLSGYFRDVHGQPIIWYPAYITFDQGTYEWKQFEVKLQAPENARYLILIIIKWQDQDSYGTLYIDDLSLTCDKQLGENFMLAGDMEKAEGMRVWPLAGPLSPIAAPKPDRPNNLAMRVSGTKEQIGNQSSYWLPMTVEPEPVSLDEPYSLPTLALDVPADFAGDHVIQWSVKTDGHVVLEGETPLVPAPNTLGPKHIEFTIWLAESGFEMLPHDIQEMYLKRLKRLGLNGIMPTLREPSFETLIDEIDFANWTSQWGRRNGMAVRSYLLFLYTPAAGYCKQHPEYWAETWVGEKTPDYRVCLTHGLDGDKYDDNKTGVRGGKDNPWLGRLYEAVKRAVKVNDLQGVWWDFEIGGVPIRKESPRPYDPMDHQQVCTCLRCRRAFADYAKLDHLASVKEIMSDEYYESWNDFKCWQHTRVWALMREAAREAKPQADFRIYSGPPGPYSRQAYGVDWTMAAKVIDVAMGAHTPFNSEGWALSHFAASEAGGRRNPLVMSVMVNGYDMNEHIGCWQTRPRLANQIIQTVVDWDCLGVALTGVWGLDSQFNGPIREASAVFAEYEEVLTTGRHDDKLLFVRSEKAEYAAWQSADGNRTVAFFFNNSNQSTTVTVVKTESWNKIEKTDNISQTDGEVSFTVPAWSHRIVQFVK